MDIPNHIRMAHVEKLRQFPGLKAHSLHHGAHGPIKNDDIFL
jgi:hypothetical protein